MATKVEKNWLSRLKAQLTNASHQESSQVPNQDVSDDEVRAALKKMMAKSILDERAKHLTYRLVII